MQYSKPVQRRAIDTERRFLDAMRLVLKTTSFKNTSVALIAEKAGLTKTAFLKRFKSKENALFALFGEYCDEASKTIREILTDLHSFESVDEVLLSMSTRLEEIQLAHFSVNRAMHEIYMENLQTHPLTVQIFKETVAMMVDVQQKFFADHSCSKMGAYSAAQLLVTINYNYVLKAMPALPSEGNLRHKLITDILSSALKR